MTTTKQLTQRNRELRDQIKNLKYTIAKQSRTIKRLEDKMLGSGMLFSDLKVYTSIPCPHCKSPMDISHYQKKLINEFMVCFEEAQKNFHKLLPQGASP